MYYLIGKYETILLLSIFDYLRMKRKFDRMICEFGYDMATNEDLMTELSCKAIT